MNKARRERKRANREGYPPVVSLDELLGPVPDLTVQAGLASAQARVEEEES